MSVPIDLPTEARLPRPLRRVRERNRLEYWISGLPVALRYRRPTGTAAIDRLRHEYSRFYWQRGTLTASKRSWALLACAPVLVASIVYYSLRNGRIIRQRTGVGLWRQAVDQFYFYVRHGILPRWYYIFSLHDPDGRERAPGFLNRFETKPALFKRLNRPGITPLGDKAAFAMHCGKHGLPHVPVLAIARNGEVQKLADFPRANLFVKPIVERGGRGAQRWTWIGGDRYSGPGGLSLSSSGLLERLARQSPTIPRLVQPNMVNHPEIQDLSNGALTTLRFLTCLDEEDRPEIIAASFRMAVGKTGIVDNFHAGGIAAAVQLDTGILGKATDLGSSAILGWLSRHPDTSAAIEVRALPMWCQAKALAVAAHRAFADRVVVGWDVAILADGPCLVEGNSGADVDLMQRPLKRGIGDGHFADLLLFHLCRLTGHCPRGGD